MKLNRRQVIEAARDHLLAQGSWAIATTAYGTPRCQYLTDGGKKCAIGGLPGFPYHPHFDTLQIPAIGILNGDYSPSWQKIMEETKEERKKFGELFDESVTGEFLQSVQRKLHDGLALNPSNGNVRPFDPIAVKTAAEMLIKQFVD